MFNENTTDYDFVSETISTACNIIRDRATEALLRGQYFPTIPFSRESYAREFYLRTFNDLDATDDVFKNYVTFILTSIHDSFGVLTMMDELFRVEEMGALAYASDLTTDIIETLHRLYCETGVLLSEMGTAEDYEWAYEALFRDEQ